MNDISQTKEGFIKSMILFIVLLGICFAPFFAFSATNESPLNVSIQVKNTRVECDITTLFPCTSYAIEGRNSGETEYHVIFSCDNAQCLDAQQSINYNFDLADYPYSEYRVKTVDAVGNAYYNSGSFNKHLGKSLIELVSNAVNDQLNLKVNGTAQVSDFTYSVSAFSGVTLVSSANLSSHIVSLSDLPQGFYIISLKHSNGEVFHYKFLRQ